MSDSMLTKANRILTIKGQIKTAIETKKGGSVTGDFSTYPTEIDNLPTGGGMPELPSSGWTQQTIGQQYTASADGWIKGKLCFGYDSFAEYKNILKVNGVDVLVPTVTDGGGTDSCWSTMNFVYPIHSGDTYQVVRGSLYSGSCRLYWVAV